MSREEARRILEGWGQEYKVEALDLIPEDEEITFYTHGPDGAQWGDLCEGLHIDSFQHEFHFKLLNLAGAYWRR